ncbi:MAG: hypothetical protein J6O51_02040 [Bacteroidales bacterium]|nr:hypothetical protein [Bacteroidales bacterium]
MNKVLYLAVTLAVITTSCAQRSRKPVTIASTSDTTALEMTVKTSVFDCPDSSLGPCRLCDQKLTSIEAVFSAFPNRTDEFLNEATAADFDPDTVTKKDTLKWIKQSQPRLSATMLDRALPNPTARMNANAILAAYSKFDGDTDDGSAFSVAFNNYRGFELPGTVSKDQLNHFEKGFWEWYDKRISVPEIDEIVKMSSRTKTVTKPTEEQLHNLRCVIEAETNIDKRTILALEYIKLSGGLDGVNLAYIQNIFLKPGYLGGQMYS